MKGRPLTDPLIAHVADPEHAWAVFQCGSEGSDGDSKERRLLTLLGRAFWPGPLTLVAPAAPAIPGAVTAETVGFWIRFRGCTFYIHT